MDRELYQLVAITDNNMEYVIELKNENKNNKGKLDFIDKGTTRFPDESILAEYLYVNGKIPTKEVRFAIKYKNNGSKYLPIVLNDMELRKISKNLDTSIYSDYIFYFLKIIEVELTKPGFLNYLIRINTRNEKELRNGNYINQKLITSIMELKNLYSKDIDEVDAKTNLRYSILRELENYKQLRTLRMFYLMYQNTLLKEEEKADFKTKKQNIEDMPDIPDDIANAYRDGGMDEVYGIVDLDDLESKGIKLK